MTKTNIYIHIQMKRYKKPLFGYEKIPNSYYSMGFYLKITHDRGQIHLILRQKIIIIDILMNPFVASFECLL